MMKEKVLDSVLDVFINLNDQSTPECYIATGKEAKSKVKQYTTRGIIDLSTLKSETFID